MAYVRYQSPDDTSFLVFDQSRFRLDHGQFLLELDPLIASLLSRLEEQREWNLEAMKLVQEHRRIEGRASSGSKRSIEATWNSWRFRV